MWRSSAATQGEERRSSGGDAPGAKGKRLPGPKLSRETKRCSTVGEGPREKSQRLL
jgi:hypothetical protein